MGNKLFQQARKLVNEAVNSDASSKDKAKNALSSAYANATTAEQAQLHEFQDQLENNSK